MNDLNTLLDVASLAPTVFILVVLWKAGIIKFGNGKNGKGGNGFQCQIDELKNHSRVANEEMGDIKKSILAIEKSLSFIRGKLDK